MICGNRKSKEKNDFASNREKSKSTGSGETIFTSRRESGGELCRISAVLSGPKLLANLKCAEQKGLRISMSADCEIGCDFSEEIAFRN